VFGSVAKKLSLSFLINRLAVSGRNPEMRAASKLQLFQMPIYRRTSTVISTQPPNS